MRNNPRSELVFWNGAGILMDLLFKNIKVITMDESLPNASCVGIEGEKIAYVGNYYNGLKAHRVNDGAYRVLIPGLYNCHTHSPMSLLRGYANDLKLQEWLNDYIFPAEAKIRASKDAIYYGALLSIADMIASGTTAFTDMYFDLPSIAKAVDESGLKACLSNPVFTLDPDYYDLFSDDCYNETIDIILNYAGRHDSRIKADVGIHAEYTSGPKAWVQAIDFANGHNLNMHLHLSETKYEHEKCKEKYGKTPTQVFDEYSLFDDTVTAAHCVWLEDADMDILADRNVSVAHNPVSNLKLASGIAPVYKMLKKGINVALGTDGVSSNNSNDLFEEIKLASILQKNLADDATVVKAHEALKMATVNGARAQGRQYESGMIKAGYDADIVMLDFNTTRQTACYDHISNIVYSVTGRDVLLTMCQGKILYENGEHKTIDIEKLIYNARKEMII